MERLKKETVIEVLQGINEGLTKKGANDEIKKIDVLVEGLVEKLEVGDKAKIGEYFTIEKKHVDAKQGRNPSNGEIIDIKAKDVVVIKATKAGKELV